MTLNVQDTHTYWGDVAYLWSPWRLLGTLVGSLLSLFIQLVTATPSKYLCVDRSEQRGSEAGEKHRQRAGGYKEQQCFLSLLLTVV